MIKACHRDASVAKRLEFYSIPEPNSGCLLWLAGGDGVGYGMVWDGQRRRGAHVVSWEVANGQRVPPGMCVCHTCDVRMCIEPRHLWLGTKADNNRDMDAKGRRRSKGGTGENNNRAKLTNADILLIRSDSRNPKVICHEYGVHWSVIYQIKNRRRWSHLP